MASRVSIAVLLFVLLSLAESNKQTKEPTVKSKEQDTAKRTDSKASPTLQTIEGTVEISGVEIRTWAPMTRVVADGGRFTGYIKSSGEFQIHNVPPGSYLVEVVSPNYIFEPIRVDISSKTGRIRSRSVDLLKAAAGTHLSYPLHFQSEKQAEFFEKREQFSFLDTLKNPMVLMLVLPLLLMLAVPKLMGSMDPESQKEMQESMKSLHSQGANLPSMEEFFTNVFGGGGKKTTTKKSKH